MLARISLPQETSLGEDEHLVLSSRMSDASHLFRINFQAVLTVCSDEGKGFKISDL